MIRLVACGRVKESWMKEGIAEYVRRIRPYEKIEVVEVKDEKAPESNSEAENTAVKKTEGQRMLKQIGEQDYVILLDLAGRPIDSVKLSETIDRCHVSGKSTITFVIGGSLGVSDELIRRADLRWKLSDNTFPHQLGRIIVLEQIYRAFRILSHEPYHK